VSKCPHCFQTLPADRFAYACQSGQCEATPDEVATALHGAPVSTTPVQVLPRPDARRGWTPPPAVPCRECRGPAGACCPACHYLLLPGWVDADVTCLAMAGARATGKSFYIAVAVRQLELLAELRNSTMEAATTATRQRYSEIYERPLYEERGIIPPTPPVSTAGSYQREPLIFSLGASEQRRRYLVLRDVAGEDLENLTDGDASMRFFRHASGVVFLFDPLTVPDVRSQLQGLVPHQLFHGGDPRSVLANVMRLIGDGRPQLAITVSKFDTLQALRSVEGTDWSRVMSNPGAAFLRDPGLGTPYDERDGELLHLEVRSLLQRLHAGSVVAAVESPPSGRPLDHRFFAVSALGDSPEGERLHDHGISPFRCLDPIRWMLRAA
jgi:hypothetical protein